VALNFPVWRKSSRSGGGADCVEVAVESAATALRDSKNPDGGQLLFDRPQWRVLIETIQSGGFA